MMRAASIALVLVLAACGSPSKGPQAGSQTNWLSACDSSSQCGELACECGTCTLSCRSDDECGGLAGASCVLSDEVGSIALCDGYAPASGLCLARCEASCPEGTRCVGGVCAGAVTPTAVVTVDPGVVHQALVGFGASLAYAEGVIVARGDKAALYDTLFADAGLDVLRIDNRYEGADEAQMQSAHEIVAAASERLGRTPALFMTSGTPPAALKANTSRSCGGDPETCTLSSLPGGGFDYPGFASYWRDSLEAYARAGVSPDYVSIQNNPNWVPAQDDPMDACRFLPEEGTAAVDAGGASMEVAYPGYREALAAVRAAVADLPAAPRFVAPEASSLAPVSEYMAALDASSVDAVALHLYGGDAAEVDVAALEAIGELAGQLDRPVFQTEMRADGLRTATLIHHALTAAGASAYLQNDIVGLAPEVPEVALVRLTGDGFEAQGPYYALAQFAKHTDPGWLRVDASSDSSELLGSAWLSPDESALTVVMVNPGTEDLDAELVFDDALRAGLARTQVIRTVFDGVERAAELGELAEDQVVRVPAGSIVTVALSAE